VDTTHARISILALVLLATCALFYQQTRALGLLRTVERGVHELRGITLMQQPDIQSTAESKDEPPVVATISTYCSEVPEGMTCSEFHAAKHREWENTCVRGDCP